MDTLRPEVLKALKLRPPMKPTTKAKRMVVHSPNEKGRFRINRPKDIRWDTFPCFGHLSILASEIESEVFEDAPEQDIAAFRALTQISRPLKG